MNLHCKTHRYHAVQSVTEHEIASPSFCDHPFHQPALCTVLNKNTKVLKVNAVWVRLCVCVSERQPANRQVKARPTSNTKITQKGTNQAGERGRAYLIFFSCKWLKIIKENEYFNSYSLHLISWCVSLSFEQPDRVLLNTIHVKPKALEWSLVWFVFR